MRRSAFVYGALFVAVSSACAGTRAEARPVGASPGRSACFGGKAIPTEGHPLLGEKLIAKLRAGGNLPDTFTCGRCRYDIGGDPGAVYYVKTCR